MPSGAAGSRSSESGAEGAVGPENLEIRVGAGDIIESKPQALYFKALVGLEGLGSNPKSGCPKPYTPEPNEPLHLKPW